MNVPYKCKRMVREYEADGFTLASDSSIPGALTMRKDKLTIYIKTEEPFCGVSFLNRRKPTL